MSIDCDHYLYGEFDLAYEYAKEDVPWDRRGYPSDRHDEKGSKWDNRIDNVGAYKNRLKSDEEMAEWPMDPSLGTFEERAFAELWDYNNNGRFSSNIINNIVYDNKEMPNLVDYKSDRVCQKVAQIMVQWLGTNVGSCFVDEARKLAKVRQEEWMKKHRPKTYTKEKERKEKWDREADDRKKEYFDKTVEVAVQKRLEEIRIKEEEAMEKIFDENRDRGMRDVDLG